LRTSTATPSGHRERSRRPLERLLLLLVLAGLFASAPACATKKHRDKRNALPPEQVYKMAMEKIAHKKYYTARDLLQAVLPRIPPEDRDLLPKVQLAIADAYFKDGGLLNYGEALNGYRNFLTYYPQDTNADRVQFMVGMSLFKQVPAPDRDQALTLKAIDEFNKLISVYPDSPFAQQARRQIELCEDELADHERLVGWFYQRRKAWNAAIDRYRGVLDHYTHYRDTGRVLYDLGRCQLKLGRRLEAEETLGRLFSDHPKDPFVPKAKKALDEFYKVEEKKERKARKPGKG
jgi:outer membrane protein assembly factor BamD